MTPSAGRLMAAVGTMVPIAHRLRYLEEWNAELWDLAEAGAGRWHQLGYATRLLTRAWTLRRELNAPHARKTMS
ncbi:hypothetical protein Airi01_087810 [Actinoallomurus iriomotensis]|uniref:Uncharacterized protein n=1 Tax=Actinoallomurus iriomotensis TaxID=478107 RepID=A0A9W6VUU0_9ACTN|nr:hypothetical protein Airi01_087810 [Actinoallomurus iriomotensis]